MAALTFALALAAGSLPQTQPGPQPMPLRVYSSSTLHVGVRPQVFLFQGDVGLVVTVQASTMLL